MEILVYGMMAAGGVVFLVNWWRIIREGYHLQQVFNSGAGGNRRAVLSSRWRFFLAKSIYALLGFAAILAGVLILKTGQG
jgi:hypothetical protein